MHPTAPSLVVKVGGAVCEEPATLDAFVTAWKARPGDKGPVVVVHGGGPQLDKALLGLGEPVVKLRGLRVTSPAAAEVVRTTLDAIGAEMARALKERGVPTVHLPSTRNLFVAVPKDPGLGRVGTVVAFDTAAMWAEAGGKVAIVTPVGWDAIGPLNINADEGAGGVARALQAGRLLLATDVAHVLDASGRPVHAMDVHEVQQFLAGPAAQGGMVPKLQAALAAIQEGAREVVIGHLEDAWTGKGTRIRGAA